jgi:N-acetylglucosamine-1-phosphate uridyltransferase (contains nucleotidyltransferase and I-patch acetyltransferase domains)
MVVILRESESYKELFPVTYIRSYYDVIIGALSLRKKLELAGIEAYIETNNPFLSLLYKNPSFSIDERDVTISKFVYLSNEEIKKFKNVSGKTLITSNDVVIGYTGNVEDIKDFKNFNKLNVRAEIISKPFDLIKYNKIALEDDVLYLSKLYEEKKISSNKLGKFGIYSNGDFILEPNVLFDARSGPIIIEDGAYIQGFTRIEGPSFIGSNSQIVSFTNIRKSYIGKSCVIGGEISNSIILDYTNSRHNSYIGDSYICTWVNIGAHTVTSNLKHTYGIIKYETLHSEILTNMTKLGSIIGDFSKTSIGCHILSGKFIGFSSMVNFIQTKSIPSFTIWQGIKGEAYEFNFDSAVETAKRFMTKKGIDFDGKMYNVFREIFYSTEEDRVKFGVKKEKLRF